ncbi:MAG: TlpA family protein disulfide reductase [Candidatus Thiodiazotropha sp. (ex Ustalcina ferruginea)]|nr:TlpA family protein disulfide reductase [Candidatus Thiodiazotropha sp. (ex Ustalcina ferruginea)]
MKMQKKYNHPVTFNLILVILIAIVCKPVSGGWLEAVVPVLRAAPLLELTDTEGDAHPMSALMDRVVLVSFWTTWCPPCIEEMPLLVRLHNDLSQSGLTILAVNVQENKRKVKQIASRLNLNFPVLLDPKRVAGNAWEVSIFPTSFLVDTHGLIRYKAIGPIQWDSEETKSVIKEMLNQRKAESNGVLP